MLKLLRQKVDEERITINIIYNFYLDNEWKVPSSAWCAVFNIAL